MDSHLKGLAALFVPFLLVCLGQPPCAAFAFETPFAPEAAAILPPDMLSGPDFSVDPAVATDGYLYVYALHTRFGDLRAPSTALLAKRIAETAALAKMDQVNSLAQFGGGIVNKGEQTLQGAADLISNPLGTIGGAVTGVGRMFANMRQDISSGNFGNGGAAAKILGVPQLKRQYAVQFGVDPYTANPLVQERLGQLASAGAAGNITGSALSALIPGGVGVAVSAAGASAMLNGVDLTASPESLARQNLSRLESMGVPSNAAALFIGDQTFSPTAQSLVVSSLASMGETGGMGAFVAFLAGTDDPDVARFRQRMAAMFAGYDAKVAPISGFVRVGGHVCALNASGALVLALPADCLFWTETNAAIVRDFSAFARNYPARGVEVWITGKASRLFAAKLRDMGWKLHERSAPLLLGEPF